LFRKGKALGEGASIAELGISDSSHLPLLETPLSTSQFPSRPFIEVSHFLNFGSVPAEISSPGLGLEGETLVTPISPDIAAWSRPRNSEYFPTPGFTTPPPITVSTVVITQPSVLLNPTSSSLNPPLFPFPPASSVPVSPVQAPSPPSSPPPNIPMVGENPP
jgi:hypothetical protein